MVASFRRYNHLFSRGTDPGRATREDHLHYGGRGRDVLRQLHPRQRAGGRVERAWPRRHTAAALYADPHRRGERQPAPPVLRRHQRVSGAVRLAVSQDALAARPALGVAVAGAGRLGPRPDTTGATRGADGVDAGGYARPPAEGARQAGALAAQPAAARCARHLELDADRHCRTAQGRARVSGRLHVARRERVHGGAARAVPVPGEGV